MYIFDTLFLLFCFGVDFRVLETTCLKNLEMSGTFTDVREVLSKSYGNVRVRKKQKNLVRKNWP